MRVMPLRGPLVASSVSRTRTRSLRAAGELASLSLKRTDRPDGSLSESTSLFRMNLERNREPPRRSDDGMSSS